MFCGDTVSGCHLKIRREGEEAIGNDQGQIVE